MRLGDLRRLAARIATFAPQHRRLARISGGACGRARALLARGDGDVARLTVGHLAVAAPHQRAPAAARLPGQAAVQHLSLRRDRAWHDNVRAEAEGGAHTIAGGVRRSVGLERDVRIVTSCTGGSPHADFGVDRPVRTRPPARTSAARPARLRAPRSRRSRCRSCRPGAF